MINNYSHGVSTHSFSRTGTLLSIRFAPYIGKRKGALQDNPAAFPSFESPELVLAVCDALLLSASGHRIALGAELFELAGLYNILQNLYGLPQFCKGCI